MHPAFSVIFLTTLIGAGQGMFLAIYTGQVYSLANLLEAQDSIAFYGAGSAIALLLLAGGLVASVFHLGRPERAWRAATRWRSSWLSREVIVLPLFMFLVFLYAVVHYVGWTGPLFVIKGMLPVDASLLIGFAASIMAFVLFICTAMIYASLKFLQEWYSPLTVANYLLFGLASGFMAAAAFSAWSGVELVNFYGAWAVVFTAMAAITRVASLYRNGRIKRKSTLQSAIGIRHTKIAQRSQGFMGGSFNTREFFHGKSQGTLDGVRWFFLVAVFLAPVAILGFSYVTASSTVAIWAFLIQYAGLLAERWYFFAEARHPQNLYYQSMA